ncbi:CPBP family intramembrane metalloprotease, partial [Halorubrum sp. Atlit-9R]
MPEWAAFVGLTGFLLTALLGLARLSQGAVRPDGGVSSTVDSVSMPDGDPTIPRF